VDARYKLIRTFKVRPAKADDGQQLGDILQAAKTRLKQRNRTINCTRARVEHEFASLHQRGGKCVRVMTLARNTLAITLQCAAELARSAASGPSHAPAAVTDGVAGSAHQQRRSGSRCPCRICDKPSRCGARLDR
jgi:IS5 family transposase